MTIPNQIPNSELPAAVTTVAGLAPNVSGSAVTLAGLPPAVQEVAGREFNVKTYGATGNGTTDDTAAIQAAINAAGSAPVYLPAGTYMVSSPISQPAGNSLLGAGINATTIRASAAVSSVVEQVNASFCTVAELEVDANGLAPYAIESSQSTETSVNHHFQRVRVQGATSYQFYNNGCEDVTYLDCATSGNEGTPNSIAPAMYVSVPGGAVRIIGGSLFGKCELSYQQIVAIGAVLGPVLIDNSAASASTVLGLYGCYLYDGPSSCIDTGTNLTNLIVDGCYLVLNSQAQWMNGNVPPGVTIDVRNTMFMQAGGSTEAGPLPLLRASGQGRLVLDGVNVGVKAGVGAVAYASVGGGTTYVTTRSPIPGVASPSRALTAPAMPASGTVFTHAFDGDVVASVSGGTVTAIAVDGVTTGLTSGAIPLSAGQTITLTYTAAPSWAWYGR